ncbi:hypothetical protein ACGF1Z_26830 [Streptomyces sp. NPDC048018]|uniref:hypothetical protein n=1 Tax=Streptomyces sp. NPDC048018 TaxID=3365499 RepID=UPI00371296C3
MALSDRHIELRRDPHSGEVLAHGGGEEAHSILQRTGFVHIRRRHEQYHRAPTGLDQATEEALATAVVSALRSVGYWVACDEPFDTDRHTAHELPPTLSARRSPPSPTTFAVPPARRTQPPS